MQSITLEHEQACRLNPKVEKYFDDINAIARTGRSISEPLRTELETVSWDEILIFGKQLAGLPLSNSDKVLTQTVIGPNAEQPLIIDTPLMISHLSFACISPEAQLALARASSETGTAIGSGSSGFFPETMQAARKFILEYVPNQYGISTENLQKAAAIEIKFGLSASPGLGEVLPAKSITEEMGRELGLPPGLDLLSPSRFPDIQSPESLKDKIDWLREASNGKPIGVKLAAGHIEADLEFALQAGPDFVTIDGRPGGIYNASKFIKLATSLPTIYALAKARKFLDRNHAEGVSLIITGGLRISPDFAKALALGADAVAIATSVLIALGCRQDRLCTTGCCPTGIAKQTNENCEKLNLESAVERVSNFIRVSTEEMVQFAKLTGHHNIHDLNLKDLYTCNSEIAKRTGISS